MSIIDRARFVMFGDVPGRKARASGAAYDPLVRAILTGLGRQAVWSNQDYATLVREGYEKCMAVYACVTMISRAAAGIEFKAQRDGEDLDEHPILDLMARPNVNEGKRPWVQKRFSQLLLAGNSYIQAVRPVASMPPAALYLPMPQRMKVLPGTNGALVGGYQYEVNGIKTPMAPELVLHSKLFHPTDDFYGLSPLSVAARGVDVSNMASEWNMRLLQNDMRPPGVLSTDGGLSKEQRARLKSEFEENYTGYDNAGRPLVLEGGLKWQQISMSPKDLDWLQASKFNKREICAVFNIAPELIGDSEAKTYSNFQEARRALYTEAVLPLMVELIDELNRWLCPMFGDNIALDIDREKIEALQEDRGQKFVYINGSRFMKIDEKRAALGLDPVGGPMGEMILVSAGDVPLEFVSVTPEPPVDEPDPQNKPQDEPDAEDGQEPGDDPKSRARMRRTHEAAKPVKSAKAAWSAPERKRVLWDNFALRVETKERTVVALSLKYLKDQAGRVARSKTVDVEAEAKSFAKTIRPWAFQAAKRAIVAGSRVAKGELPEIEEKVDLAGPMTAARQKTLDDMILRSGTKIAESTMAHVRDTLRVAELENWTTEELTQKLIAKLEEFAQWRCRTIARTESAKVENWGQVEGYGDTEFVTKKGWMCSFVPESREDHEKADGQEVALSEDFMIGGQAMAYPGDPKGDAGNVVNCLCTTYAVVE
jgi:HK97 family phage portal protein